MFGADVDCAMLVKLYGEAPESAKGRCSPAERLGARKQAIEGKADPAHIGTSYAERQSLTVRMHMRRFTWLTNAFSMEAENRACSAALDFMYYTSSASTRSCAPPRPWRRASQIGSVRSRTSQP
jgi:hypothetical protein